MNTYKSYVLSTIFLLNIIPNSLVSMYGAQSRPPRTRRFGFQSPHVSPDRAFAGSGLRRSVSDSELGVSNARSLIMIFKYSLKVSGLFKSKRESFVVKVKHRTVSQIFCASIADVSRAILKNFFSPESVYLGLLHEWMLEFDPLVKGTGAQVLGLELAKMFGGLPEGTLSADSMASCLRVDASGYVLNPDLFVSTHIYDPLMELVACDEVDWDQLHQRVQLFFDKFADLSGAVELHESFRVLNIFLDTYAEYKKSSSASAYAPSPARSTDSNGSVGIEIAAFSRLGFCSEISLLDGLRAANPTAQQIELADEVAVVDVLFKAPVTSRAPAPVEDGMEETAPLKKGRLSIVIPPIEAKARGRRKRAERSSNAESALEGTAHCGLNTDVLGGYGDVAVHEDPRKKAMTTHFSELGGDDPKTALRNAPSAVAAEAVPEFDLGSAAFDVEAFLAAHEEAGACGRVTPDLF